MRIKKPSILQVMTPSTDGGSILLEQSRERCSMMQMTQRTILHRWLVGHTLCPESSDPPMAIKTKRRLTLYKVFIEA